MHLWSLTPHERGRTGREFFAQAQDMGFYSLLFLAKALGVQDNDTPLQIVVVSNNIQHVTGEELVCPERATILGPCRVIPQEQLNITCRSIDIDLPDAGELARSSN